MQSNNINLFVRWWMGSNLPYQDIYELPSLIDKSTKSIIRFRFMQWFIHPIKRKLAKRYLNILRRFSDIKVIAVTGSSGKTTTIQMLESILKLKSKTVVGRISIDPVYNIPNAILKCGFSTKYLILEAGVEYPGEMDLYLSIAVPDIAVITNIYPTHTKYFGDPKGVFKEKSKLVLSLKDDSVTVLNNENNYLRTLYGKLKGSTFWFGNGGDIIASNIRISEDLQTSFFLSPKENTRDKIKINLPVIGKQYVNNALAASLVAISQGYSLKEIKLGLQSFTPPKHRMTIIKHKSGSIIFDDSYNNNPEAAKSSIDSFSECSSGKNKIVIFGDMLELGKLENKYHRDLGKYIAKINPTSVICVGKTSKITADVIAKMIGKDHVVFRKSVSEVVNDFNNSLKSNTHILIKGSRSIGLDKLVSELHAS